MPLPPPPALEPEVEHSSIVIEEAIIEYAGDLAPGLWFESRGRLYRLHDSLRYRLEFVHDLLLQPAFVEDLHRAYFGEPVTERFAYFVESLVREDIYRRRSHLRLALASGFFHLRLGASSPLRFLTSWDAISRALRTCYDGQRDGRPLVPEELPRPTRGSPRPAGRRGC